MNWFPLLFRKFAVRLLHIFGVDIAHVIEQFFSVHTAMPSFAKNAFSFPLVRCRLVLTLL